MLPGIECSQQPVPWEMLCRSWWVIAARSAESCLENWDIKVWCAREAVLTLSPAHSSYYLCPTTRLGRKLLTISPDAPFRSLQLDLLVRGSPPAASFPKASAVDQTWIQVTYVPYQWCNFRQLTEHFWVWKWKHRGCHKMQTGVFDTLSSGRDA